MSFTQLQGERVSLIPLEFEHTDWLFECSRFPEIWEHLPLNIQSKNEMDHYINAAMIGREQGVEYPFVVYDKQFNKIVGMTRYLRISRAHNNLSIGWTWYSPEVWRTTVNTESKYLLLKYAFEVWKAVRIEIITTTTHKRSQRAIERLGAKKEGILRKKYNGLDYIVYSILDEEWDSIKERLETLLRYSY